MLIRSNANAAFFFADKCAADEQFPLSRTPFEREKYDLNMKGIAILNSFFLTETLAATQKSESVI